MYIFQMLNRLFRLYFFLNLHALRFQDYYINIFEWLPVLPIDVYFSAYFADCFKLHIYCSGFQMMFWCLCRCCSDTYLMKTYTKCIHVLDIIRHLLK